MKSGQKELLHGLYQRIYVFGIVSRACDIDAYSFFTFNHKYFVSSIPRDIENFEKALDLPDGSYALFCGYCYIEIITPKLSGLANIVDINCHRHFLYSCLRPECVFVPTAWMHTLTIARNFEKHLSRVNKIINELVGTGSPMLMIEAPAAMHRYIHADGKGLSPEHISERRGLYYEKIVRPGGFMYLDLNKFIPQDSDMIRENSNDERNSCPWHMNDPFYGMLCDIFIDWKNSGYKNYEISAVQKMD
jgi:hypothetical protein